MNTEKLKINDWVVLKGFERNRPVQVKRIEPYDYVRDGKHFKYNKIWVKTPEGDLLDINDEDLRDPNNN